MRKYIASAAAFLLSVPGFAQNLDTSVSVTNDYNVRMPAVEKKGVEMFVPDTLLQFDYKFDYSVFDSPYKGAYEFRPYSVNATPESNVPAPGRFYLRAGAGIALSPEFDFVWAPVVRSGFTMDVRNNLDGYKGRYEGFDGYDFKDSFGIDANSIFTRNTLKVSAGYEGIFTGSDIAASTAMNTASLSASLKSLEGSNDYLTYDATVRYSFSSTRLGGATDGNEHNFSLLGTVGPVIGGNYRVLVDLSLEGDYSGKETGLQTLMQFTPRFVIANGTLNLSAGARISVSGERAGIFPAVNFDIPLAYGRFDIFANVTGGDRLNGYRSLKLLNHHFNSTYGGFVPTRENLDADLGFRGWLGQHFQYCLRAGWKSVSDAPYVSAATVLNEKRETFEYVDYKRFYANALLSWQSERFTADGRFEYGRTDFENAPEVYSDPLFSGNFRAVYNCYKRLFAGVSAAFESGRSAEVAGVQDKLPGWLDLGLDARFKFTDKAGVWVRVGNLLGQPVRRSALYAEKSPQFILGITLSL